MDGDCAVTAMIRQPETREHSHNVHCDANDDVKATSTMTRHAISSAKYAYLQFWWVFLASCVWLVELWSSHPQDERRTRRPLSRLERKRQQGCLQQCLEQQIQWPVQQQQGQHGMKTMSWGPQLGEQQGPGKRRDQTQWWVQPEGQPQWLVEAKGSHQWSVLQWGQQHGNQLHQGPTQIWACEVSAESASLEPISSQVNRQTPQLKSGINCEYTVNSSQRSDAQNQRSDMQSYLHSTSSCLTFRCCNVRKDRELFPSPCSHSRKGLAKLAHDWLHELHSSFSQWH